MHQTPIVDELWRQRASLKENKEKTDLVKPSLASSKPPAESFTSIEYDFDKNEDQRNEYMNPWGKVALHTTTLCSQA